MRNLSAYASIAIVTIALSGCHKAIDYLPHGIPGKGDHYKSLRIKTLEFPAGNITPSLTYEISYNPAGDPDSVVANKDHIIQFTYDNRNRLTELTYRTNDTTFGEVIQTAERTGHHWYWYEGKRIIKDSLWEDQVFAGGESQLIVSLEVVSMFFYDTQDRIIKDTFVEAYTHQGGTSFRWESTNYPYDANGNLLASHPIYPPEPITYDRAFSYLRLHPIWMFLTRNYSVNNEQGATSYNQLELPLGFQQNAAKPGRQNLFADILWSGGRPIQLTYESGKH